MRRHSVALSRQTSESNLTHYNLSMFEVAILDANEGVIALPLAESGRVDVGSEPAECYFDARIEGSLSWEVRSQSGSLWLNTYAEGLPNGRSQYEHDDRYQYKGPVRTRCPPRHMPVAKKLDEGHQ